MEEIRDATMNMTLGEIRKRDIDNTALVYATSKRFVFELEGSAKIFISNCISKALSKWGIDREAIAKKHGNNFKDYMADMEKQLASKQVVLEKPRIRKGEEHSWRSGVYIYYRNEIAYFISLPFPVPKKKSADPHIIIPGRTANYMVVTNAPV